MQNVRPVGARLYVKMDKETLEPLMVGSIIVPATYRGDRSKTFVTAEVISVGNGNRHKKTGKRIPMSDQLKPGVRVVTQFYWGDMLGKDDDDDETYRIIGEQQVLGVMDENWEVQPLSI